MECKMSPNDILLKLTNWDLVRDGRDAISREFKFLDFKKLLHL